jgi:hypothetical protein
MIDTVQVILVLVILILAVLLVVLGVQVFFILRELRSTVKKTNKILTDAAIVTDKVTGPIASFASIAEGITTGTAIAKVFKIGLGILTKSDSDETAKKKE